MLSSFCRRIVAQRRIFLLPEVAASCAGRRFWRGPNRVLMEQEVCVGGGSVGTFQGCTLEFQPRKTLAASTEDGCTCMLETTSHSG